MRSITTRGLAAALLMLLAGATSSACSRDHFPGDATLDPLGRTPLMVAAIEGNLAQVQQALALHCDLERTWRDRTPLHWAAMHGAQEVVDSLLDAGARIDARNRSGEYAFELAIESGRVATARSLLARGAGALQGPLQHGLLHMAAHTGSVETIELALELGLPIDARWRAEREFNHSASPALHIACATGSVVAVLTMIEHGAELGTRTDEGWTALHVAAAGGYAEIVGLLLQRGADATAIDALGRSVAHVAAELDRAQVLWRLRERLDATNWTAIATAVDKFGRTPLHLAAWAGGASSVRILLPLSDRGARTLTLGWTAAHLAALADDDELMRALLPEGAPPVDEVGRQPEDLLLRSVEARVASIPESGATPPRELSASTSDPKLASWFRDAITRARDPRCSYLFQLWADGVYVREVDGTPVEYTVGVLPHTRVESLFEELREAGLLEHTKFEYEVTDGGSEQLRLSWSGREHVYVIWGGLLAGVQGDFAERIVAGEVNRALSLLRRARANVEEPLRLHLVDGAFRGFRPDRQRAER